MYYAFAGMTRDLCWVTLLATYNMRYRLHTRFMLTDMKIIKQKGTTRVKIIEFCA